MPRASSCSPRLERQRLNHCRRWLTESPDRLQGSKACLRIKRLKTWGHSEGEVDGTHVTSPGGGDAPSPDRVCGYTDAKRDPVSSRPPSQLTVSAVAVTCVSTRVSCSPFWSTNRLTVAEPEKAERAAEYACSLASRCANVWKQDAARFHNWSDTDARRVSESGVKA